MVEIFTCQVQQLVVGFQVLKILPSSLNWLLNVSRACLSPALQSALAADLNPYKSVKATTRILKEVIISIFKASLLKVQTANASREQSQKCAKIICLQKIVNVCCFCTTGSFLLSTSRASNYNWLLFRPASGVDFEEVDIV